MTTTEPREPRPPMEPDPLDAPEFADDVRDDFRTLRRTMRERLISLVARVYYRPDDYVFVVGITEGMKYPYLQVRHYRPDSTTGVPAVGAGGKAYISEWASDSEVFQTMLGLAKGYEEHEVREFLFVDGVRVFGPHISTEALATVADRLDARQHVASGT